MKYLDVTMKVLAIVQGVVLIIEQGGADGATKRAEAIVKVKELLAVIQLPDWAKAVFVNDAVIGGFIDLLVFVLNKTGVFQKGNA